MGSGVGEPTRRVYCPFSPESGGGWRKDKASWWIFLRLFVKWFALCYWTVVCLSACLSVTLVYCGQTAGWIKMRLRMEVGLGPFHSMLHGDQAPPKGHSPAIFGPCPLWPHSWMDSDATWYGGSPRPRPHCVRWWSSSPRKGAQPPNFRSMSGVAKRCPSQLLLSTCHVCSQCLNSVGVVWGRACSRFKTCFIYGYEHFCQCVLHSLGYDFHYSCWK